jgi:hypothetical protein
MISPFFISSIPNRVQRTLILSEPHSGVGCVPLGSERSWNMQGALTVLEEELAAALSDEELKVHCIAFC